MTREYIFCFEKKAVVSSDMSKPLYKRTIV